MYRTFRYSYRGTGFLLLLAVFFAYALPAVPTKEEARRYQALLDLTNDFVVMCVAAHPDDEDGQTLTYLRKKLGVETIVVVASRGEGGQNEIGPELYKDLGIIRTHEMDAAGKINGAKYFNLNNIDFGFSKSADEAIERWGWDPGLRNLVKLIRRHKPNIIITHHDKVSGHGHHQVTGRWVEEAFDLAADEEFYIPYNIDGDNMPAWQASHMFVRTRNPDDIFATVISTPVGETDPFYEETYANIARRGLAQHRSQGMDKIRSGGPPRRGGQGTQYKLIKSAPGMSTPQHTLLDDIPNNSPYAGRNFLRMSDDALLEMFESERSKYFSAVETASHSRLLQDRYQMAHAAVAGARLLLSVTNDQVTSGEEFIVQAILETGRLTPSGVIVECIAGSKNKNWTLLSSSSKSMSGPGTAEFRFSAPENDSFTVPHSDYYYGFDSNLPVPQFPFRASIHYGKDQRHSEETGQWLSVDAEMFVDYLPVAEIKSVSKSSLASPVGRPVLFELEIRNNSPETVHRRLQVTVHDGWELINNPGSVSVSPHSTKTVPLKLKHPDDLLPGDYSIPVTFGAKPSAQTSFILRKIDVQVAPDLLVGLVKSYDNTLEQALEQLGVAYALLDEGELTSGDLNRFDTILLDIRAYLVRDDLVKNNRRILEYVHAGGHVICMYNKTFEWNQQAGEENYAPYPIQLGRQRVTREDAPVGILMPEHPLFKYPNTITDEDWEDWVQERGLYFPADVPDDYLRLLSSRDPAETPLRNGHLIAQYGKGTYLYTSYVWYRQLKVLIPGGVRNFANMISLPGAVAAGFSMP